MVGEARDGSRALTVDPADALARLADAAISRLARAVDAWEAADATVDDAGCAAAVADLEAAVADPDTVRGLAAAYAVDAAEVDALLSRLGTIDRWATRARDLGRAVRAAARQQERKAREAAHTERIADADPETWSQLAMAGDPPMPARTRRNVEIILTTDPRYAGRSTYDEFAGVAQLDGRERADTDETRIATDIGATYGIHYSPAEIGQMLDMVAQAHPRHPVREYLDGLAWDERPRLATELPRWLGADTASPIVPIMIRLTMIAAVARIREPGSKVDTVLVLAGPQGAGKSSALRALAGDAWHADQAIDIRSKDARQALRGVWIYEWAELDSVRRSDVTAVKSFISEQVDRYRPPYGRNVESWPRQCIITGTTNESGILRDPTGHRRFWVVPVRHEINVHAIRGARDQLWAEAVAAYEAGEQWWLSPAQEDARAAIAAEYEAEDPWTDDVLSWLHGRGGAPATTRDVLADALGKLPHEMTKADEMRVAEILRGAGWARRRLRIDGLSRQCWLSPDDPRHPENEGVSS